MADPQLKVKYVYIPADVGDEIQEREISFPKSAEVECLLNELKAHFSRAGGSKTPAQRQAQKEALLKQVGAEAAAKMTSEMLDAATNLQMVENIALLPNSPEFGFVGVNMYCDDEAQAKELPRNPRASSIAEASGRLLEVHGDAFIARVFDNEDDFARQDFTLSEVSSSAQWVRDAAAYAQRKRDRDGPTGPDGVSTSQRNVLDRLQQQGQAKGKAPASAKVTELTPAEAEKDAGNAAFKRQDWAGAVDRYTAALKLDPGLTAALNNRAMAYLNLQRPAEAEADATSVLQREPNNVKALYRRATARKALGNMRGAAQDAGAVLAVDPNNKDATTFLAGLGSAAPPTPPAESPAAMQDDAAPGQAACHHEQLSEAGHGVAVSDGSDAAHAATAAAAADDGPPVDAMQS